MDSWSAPAAALAVALGLMTLVWLALPRVSGVTLLERRLQETKPAYRAYAKRTNAFFPWFPRSDEP